MPKRKKISITSEDSSKDGSEGSKRRKSFLDADYISTSTSPKYSKLIAKTRAKSLIWGYFGLPADENGHVVSNAITICKVCTTPISSKGGTTTNMISHLKVHHPLEYMEMTKGSKQFLPLSYPASRVYEVDVNSSSSLEEIEVECVLKPVADSDHQDLEKQEIILDDQGPDLEFLDSITESVTKFLACTMQPSNLVDKKPFIDMVRNLNPNYELPGRKYFSKTGIPKLYSDAFKKMKQEMASVKDEYMTITMDCWTSVSNTPYIAVTIHFIDTQWNLKSTYLNCACFEINHSHGSICDTLSTILSDWDIDVANVPYCTTDNGSNVLKAISDLHLQHIPCFGHSINIGINQALEIPPLERAVSKLKKLQSVISHSSAMKHGLAEAQELLQLDVADLPVTCPAIWRSTLKLVRSFLSNEFPIKKMLEGHPDKTHLWLEECDVSALKDFVSCTKLLEDVTTTLSGEEYVTASSVLPLYGKIKKNLQSQDSDSALSKQIKSEISSALSEPYKDKSLKTVLWMSSFCDPRFRLSFTDNPDDIKAFAIQKMTSFYASFDSSDQPDNQGPQMKEGLELLFDIEDTDSGLMPEQKAESELNCYLAMPKVNWNINPLTWWKLHEDSFPVLNILARKYLAIQGSSVSSERVFSTGGDAVMRQRAALLPKHAEMQIFLAQNSNSI